MLYSWLKTITLFLFAPYLSRSSCNVILQLPQPQSLHQLGYGKDPNVIYIFGGYTTSLQVNIYKWNVSITTFTTLSATTPTDKFVSYSNNVASINDMIYFVGTDDGSSDSGIVYIFNVVTEWWIDNTNITKTPYPSIYGCLTANSTHLFTIGGYNSETFLDQLQIYDIYRNTWFVEQINVSPIYGDGWAFGYCQYVDAYLYIFGGEVGQPDNRTDGIFKWNPTEQWSIIGNLPLAQSRGRSVSHYHNIYVIGGKFEAGPIRSIYQFDTNTETIVAVYNMTQSLTQAAATIINHKLYIFGGYNNIDFESSDVQMCDILDTLEPTAVPSAEPTTVNPTTSASTTQSVTTLNPSISDTTMTPLSTNEQKITITSTHIESTRDQSDHKHTTVIFIDSINETTLENTDDTIYTSHNVSLTTDATDVITTDALSPEDDQEIDDDKSVSSILVLVIVTIIILLIAIAVSLRFVCFWRKQKTMHHGKNLAVNNQNAVEKKQVPIRNAVSLCNEENDNHLKGTEEYSVQAMDVTVEGFKGEEGNEGEVNLTHNVGIDQHIVYNLNNDGDEEVIGDDDDTQTTGR